MPFPCPEGGYCGNALEGVQAQEVVALQGFFRVLWAPNPFISANVEVRGGREQRGEEEGDESTKTSVEDVCLTFNPCRIASNCLGAPNQEEGCKMGTTGPLCSKCKKHFTKSGTGFCTKCMPSATQNLLFIAGALVGLSGLIFMINGTLNAQGRAGAVSMGILKVGMRHLQLASMAASFPLQWPGPLRTMFAAMDTASSAGDQAVSIDCQLEETSGAFVAKASLAYTLPLFLVMGFFVVWALYAIYERHRDGADIETDEEKGEAREEEGMVGEGKSKMGGKDLDREEQIIGVPRESVFIQRMKTRFIVSTFVLMLMLHPSLTKTTFSFFKCSDKIGGKSLLEADMDIECWAAQHMMLIVTRVLPALLLYVLGTPAVALGFLFRNQHQLEDEKVASRLGFFYSNYQGQYFYWEIVVMTRLVLFAAISVLFADDVSLQAGLGLFVLFISLLLHEKAHPYQEDAINAIESFGLLTTWVTLYGGTLLYSSSVGGVFKIFVTISIVVCNAVYVLYLLHMLHAARQRKQSDGAPTVVERLRCKIMTLRKRLGLLEGTGEVLGETRHHHLQEEINRVPKQGVKRENNDQGKICGQGGPEIASLDLVVRVDRRSASVAKRPKALRKGRSERLTAWVGRSMREGMRQTRKGNNDETVSKVEMKNQKAGGGDEIEMISNPLGTPGLPE